MQQPYGVPVASRAAAPTLVSVPPHAVPYQPAAHAGHLRSPQPVAVAQLPAQPRPSLRTPTQSMQPPAQPQPRSNLRPLGAPAAVAQSAPQVQQRVPVVVAAPAKPPPPPEAATDQADHDLRPGDWVKLAGVAHNADYQEKAFQVEQANCGDGRIMAKFTHNGVIKKLYLDPSAVEKIDAEAHGLSTELPPQNTLGSAAAPLAAAAAPKAMSGTVRIVNLSVRPEYNGKIAQVLPPGIPDANGRLKVQVEGNAATVLDLPPSYLEPLDPEPAGDATVLPETTEFAGLRLQERVQIHGLASRPHHNGRTGIVESLDAANNTIVVAFDHVGPDGVGRVALNPNYLSSLDQPCGSAAAGSGSAHAPIIEPNPAALVEAAQVDQNTGSEAPFQPGDRVRVRNLAPKPEYNGQTCIVKAIHDASTGEVVVGFESPDLAQNMLLLGPDYLERC